MRNFPAKKVALFSVVLYILLTLIMAFSVRIVARADGSLAEEFEKNNVLDDLEGAMIEGKEFHSADYKVTLWKDTAVISLMEFCYAANPSLQGDWGLYLYVYNPKKYLFTNNQELNKVQLSFGSSESYHKYPLKFLNASVKEGCEGLFFKYKVIFTDSERKEALRSLDPNERIYRMGEIELQRQGDYNAESVTVAKIYRYTGFVQGYGSETGNLQSSSEETDVITLRKDQGEVGFTWFRPDGSNGKNEFTRDSLHSVYFVVPNSFIERFGEMTEVHATWRDAILAPSLVTGNETAYDAITPFLGKRLNITKTGFGDLGFCYLELNSLSMSGTCFHYTWGYNVPGSESYNFSGMVSPSLQFQGNPESRSINPLYMMYFSGKDNNSADSYHLTSEEILSKLKVLSAQYGGDLVNGKYSEVLFDSVAENWEDKTFKNTDKTQPLTKQKISKSFWEYLFGGNHVEYSTTFDGLEAIHTVTEKDFLGTVPEVSKRLFVDEGSVDEIKSTFERFRSDHTMFLLRYQVSDYISKEATLVNDSGIYVVDTNAYFFQETVNLDFDIIDVTFSNGEKSTVIPVGMTPFDVIPGVDPPLNITSDEGFPLWVKIVLMVVLVVAALWLVSYTVKWMRRGTDYVKPKHNRRR